MKRFRRILSSVLALSLLLGMFSLNGSAMAQESAIDSQTVLSTGTAVGDTYEAPETPRQQINFNREWKFKSQSVTDDTAPDFGGAIDPAFDDSEWTNVGLPHSFSIPYNMETNFFVGYGMYRKTFDVPQEWLDGGKRISIEFEGAFIETEVFVNGEAVGTHNGGYTGFTFDITDNLHAGENVIAVRVNNKWNPEQNPRTGDHHFSGGIYRDVYLNITDGVHVAWYGTAVTTPALNNPGFDEKNEDGTLYHDYENIDEESYTPAEEIRENIAQKRSDVRVQTEVQNDSDTARTIVVKQEVVDTADNTLVASFASDPTVVAANSTAVVDTQSDYIQNIKLWSPDEPNLYRVYTTIYDGEGNAIDLFESPLGFRWAQFLNDGFYLNGEKTVLFGANAHQDHAGWGDAVTNEGFFRDVQMIKDAGMNFIRGSHYPHDPAYADACDELGIMLWSEVSLWAMGGGADRAPTYTASDWNNVNGYPTNPEHYEAFNQACLRELSDMIRIFRNHPSVIIWSMGNELFFPMGQSDMQVRKDLVNEMRNLAHLLDPTRKAGMGGVQREGFDTLDVCDVAGYNGDGGSAELPEEGQGMPGHMTEYMPSISAEYGSHTTDRGSSSDEFRPYFGDMQDGGDIYNYALKGNRAGISLWCAFQHGSVGGSGLAKMGFIDYSRLPLKAWYWYRQTYTGVPAEFSKEGTGDHLELTASQDTIPNDGTADTHLIVTVKDENGDWVNQSPTVTLEVIDGPGVFPTGKVMTLTGGNLMRDGKGATEFRSYYSGTTVIEATAPGMEPAEITITTTATEPEYGRTEPDNFLIEEKEDTTDKLLDAGNYRADKTGHPTFPSSGNGAMANDGDTSTQWVAENAGPDEYWMQDTEYALHMYKLKLDFEGTPYPYKVEVATNESGPWTEIASYTADTVANRPYEEDLGGIRARFVKITFTDVPEGEHAFLNEATLYGIDAQGAADETAPYGYTMDSVYVSDLEPVEPITQGWAGKTPGIDKSIEGNPITVGGIVYEKGLGLHANSEAVYNLDGKYTRFQAIAGIDDEVGGNSADAIFRVYATVGDSEEETLIYEKQITNGASDFVDLSVRGVTRLRLVTDENGGNGNDHTDWADAKLLGATRDISKADTSYTTTVASSSQGLQPGTDFKAYVTMKNTGSSNPYAASLALYDSEGNLVDVSILEDRISQKGNESITLEIPVTADAGLGYEARLNIYDPETLELMATTAHFGMQTETSASTQRVLRAAYAAAPASAQDGDAYVTVDGESASVVKEGAWGLWNDSGAYEGTETFVGDSYDWEGASLSLTFTGTQVIVGGKIDGSQAGADVYLDGELVDHINSNSSANGGKNGYFEVWRSGALDYDTHTIQLVPTGKFSVDYFSYLTENPWDKVDGEDEAVVKEGTWALWESGDAYNGTETYVGDNYDWQGTSLSYTFNGIQVCVGAKVDGSQVGANIYIDDALIATINTNVPEVSQQGYKRVWVSPVLTEGEHTIRLEPTGKFGFDYFESLKSGFEDMALEPTVQLTELLNQIARAKALSSAAYTDESWDAMQEVLEEAETVRDTSRDQAEIDAAAEALSDAIDQLIPYIAPSDEVKDAFLQAMAAVLAFIESDSANQYDPEGVAALAETFSDAYDLYEEVKPSEEAFIQMTADLLEKLEALQPASGEYALTVKFPAGSVRLSIDGEDQTIANLIGSYQADVLSGTELNLAFTPSVEGREIAGVTVNGEAIAEDSFDVSEYVYSAAMPNADTTIELGFTVVDKQNLRAAIEIAEGRADEAAEAVPSVQEKYEAALQAAKDVEAKKTATQDEINTAWSDLIDALHYLSFVAGDKSQLDIPMEIADSINRDLFTPDSLKALDEAYAAAEDLLDDEEVLEADITAAVDALYDAIYGLVYRADVTELEALVTKGDGIVANADQYIQNDAWTSFETSLEEAKTVLANENATQDAVDTAAEDLAAAISALRLIPDKDALEALIGEAEAINTNKYTAKSVATMKAALSTAKAVLNDAEATEEEVADAVEALENSIDGLVEKSTSTSSKNSGSTSANVGNAYGAAGVVSASQSVSAQAYVVSDTTVNFTLKRGSAYCFKMTVVNGNNMVPSFTVGNGDVLKTQFVAKVGNDYYYRVYAIGAPGQNTGVYTTLPGQNATKHCTVTIG